MFANKIKATTRITVEKLELTADDWQLFTSEPGAEEAAQKINTAIMEACNAGLGRYDVQRAADKVMATLSDFGAQDSEPGHTLEDLLDALFGEVRR